MEPIQITVDKNGVTTLATAGKYCDRNIDVAVSVTEMEDALVNRTVEHYTNDRVTEPGTYAFNYCKNLVYVSFPNAVTTGNGVCYLCSSLTDVSFPVATKVGQYAFYGCTELRSAIFPCAKEIDAEAFRNCTSLEALILQNTEVATLFGTTVFTGTPIASGAGVLYVPDELVNRYKTATNWSKFADQIKPISELEESS